MLDVFSCAYFPPTYFWGEMCVQIFYPLLIAFNGVIYLYYWVVRFISWLQALYDVMICRYFLPICGLSFDFLNGVFEVQIFIVLMRFSLLMFFFQWLDFGVISQKSLPNPRLWKFLLVFSSKRFIVWLLHLSIFS